MPLDELHCDREFDQKFYSRLLDSSVQGRSRSKAVQAEALRLMRREAMAAGSSTPPADLNRLASRLGVRRIKAVPLSMRGRLVVDNGDYVIEISEDLDDCRRRHTTAHELAHIVLERERVAMALAAGQNVPRRTAHSLIEQLCDLCADEVLLLQEWLENRVGARVSLKTVLDVAAEANLSADFVVRRIVCLELQPWRALWCKRFGCDVRITESIPRWDDFFLTSVQLVHSDECPLRRCWTSEGIAKGHVRLRIDDEEIYYPAQAIKTDGEHALGILYTGRLPR